MLAVYLVDTELDSIDPNDGYTSLREAVSSANASTGSDTILFLTTISNKTISLTHGELPITDSLTIIGPGAGLLSVDASGNDPTPTQKNQDGSRVFNIDGPGVSNLTVLIIGLTMTGGDSPGEQDSGNIRQGGGAIRNQEDLTLINCSITNSSGYKGGAIATDGPLQIASCVITGNSSFGNGGGGIYADSNTPVSISDSTITGNTSHTGGGGIYQNIGTMTVANSTISHNIANGSGGGILADAVRINSSDVSVNTSSRYGGGVYATSATITSSTVNGNNATNGGGVFSDGQPSVILDSTISGNEAGRYGGGIYAGGNVAISNTTIEDNISHWGGGGISGTDGSAITLMLSRVRGNTVDGDTDSDGGGIFSSSSLELADSDISGNTASGDGGGVSNSGYSTLINRCTIAGNEAGSGGGGISISDYYLELKDSEVNNNTTADSGGGIEWGTLIAKPIVIDHSTISGNSANTGGGLYGSGGSCNISQSSVTNNIAALDGGGLFSAASGAMITVAGSTISGNKGRNGAGIYSNGLALANCLLTGNTAAVNGGGLFNGQSTTTILSSTISNNTAANGGGAFVIAGALSIGNTIVARNTALSGTGVDIVGLVAADFSLIGDGTGAMITNNNGNLIGTAAAPVDPLLSTLTYNGGPIFIDGSHLLTRALMSGSPAINAGDPAATGGENGVSTNDERGAPFVRISGGLMDIGAFESQPNPLPGDYNFNGVVDAADYIVWRKTLGSTSNLQADGDGNGVINSADNVYWKSNFGNSVSSGAAVTALEAGTPKELAFAQVGAAPAFISSTASAPVEESSLASEPLLPRALAFHLRLQRNVSSASLANANLLLNADANIFPGANEQHRELAVRFSGEALSDSAGCANLQALDEAICTLGTRV